MYGPLLTDLYQLTMLQAYFDRGMDRSASFEFFVRKLPVQRNFLMAAGLEQVLQFLEALRFEAGELEWLASTGRFKPAFLQSLKDLRFTGDAWAMAEGTVFFPDEPILRINAPLREAQLVESRVINLLNFQTMVASKAARCVRATRGRALPETLRSLEPTAPYPVAVSASLQAMAHQVDQRTPQAAAPAAPDRV